MGACAQANVEVADEGVGLGWDVLRYTGNGNDGAILDH